MRSRLIAGSVAALSVFTAILQGTGQGQSQNQSRNTTSVSRETLKPKDDEEKALAAYFASYRDSSRPLKGGEIVGIGPIESGPPPPTPQLESVELKDAVCKTDAIVSGTVTKSRVFFNKHETFLITTYLVRPDYWVRPLDPTRQTGTLRVVIPGGEAIIDGKTTKALGSAQLADNERVVLWLRKAKGASAFVLAPQIGTLTFEGNSMRTAYPTRIAVFQKPNSRANVLTIIANIAAGCEG